MARTKMIALTPLIRMIASKTFSPPTDHLERVGRTRRPGIAAGGAVARSGDCGEPSREGDVFPDGLMAGICFIGAG
jgi:hypothetical protein